MEILWRFMEVLWRHIDQTWPHWLEAAQQTAVPASPVRSGSNSEVFASWDYWRPQTSLPCVASQTKRTWMNLEYAQLAPKYGQSQHIPTISFLLVSGPWSLWRYVEMTAEYQTLPDYIFTQFLWRERPTMTNLCHESINSECSLCWGVISVIYSDIHHPVVFCIPSNTFHGGCDQKSRANDLQIPTNLEDHMCCIRKVGCQ